MRLSGVPGSSCIRMLISCRKDESNNQEKETEKKNKKQTETRDEEKRVSVSMHACEGKSAGETF